jgi:glycosyltransferase involved in cell wall biosynthesis
MTAYDITAVINGHAEGFLAQISLRSLINSADAAIATGLKVELLAILDNPNDLTSEVFKTFANTRPDLKIMIVSHGDLGFSRNTAVREAKGQWIAFLDADDIWCEQWLVLAHAAAEGDPRKVVWHPEANAYFGITSDILLHVDMEDPAFHIADLVHANLWTSLCFSSTEILRTVPYTGTDLENNIGYEDWCWNIDVVKSGGIHKIVPNTAHAIRTRATSLVKQTTAAACVPRPSDFFRNLIDCKLPAVINGVLRRTSSS